MLVIVLVKERGHVYLIPEQSSTLFHLGFPAAKGGTNRHMTGFQFLSGHNGVLFKMCRMHKHFGQSPVTFNLFNTVLAPVNRLKRHWCVLVSSD